LCLSQAIRMLFCRPNRPKSLFNGVKKAVLKTPFLGFYAFDTAPAARYIARLASPGHALGDAWIEIEKVLE